MKEKEIQQLIKSLYDIGAIKFGDFTLKDGKRSPYYVDLRILPSHPEVLREIGKVMAYMIINSKREERPDVLCGIPSAGLAIANVISFETDMPVVYTKKEPIIYFDLINYLRKFLKGGKYKKEEKEGLEKAIELVNSLTGLKTHGIKRYVDGNLQNGARVGIVDDLITTGESKLEAINLIKEEARSRNIDVTVVGVYVFLDRGEGGREALQKAGIPFYAAVTVKGAAKMLFDLEVLTKEKYDIIVKTTKL